MRTVFPSGVSINKPNGTLGVILFYLFIYFCGGRGLWGFFTMKLAWPKKSGPGHLKPDQEVRFSPSYIFPGLFTSEQARP